ncbi:hypothetical protein JB92DRAFT_3119383 [Gautieria morchelliformis]|nr:hypothetical protein JB92DRAFT_3119383 [Gautieria morchelliformis]
MGHKHDHIASQLDNIAAALMEFGKELHQIKEIRLKDAAMLEDVQMALRSRGERGMPHQSSRQSTASERGHNMESPCSSAQFVTSSKALPPYAALVEQDVQFRNEPQGEQATPMDLL